LTVADPHVTSSPLCVLLSTSRHVGGELLVLVSEQYLSIDGEQYARFSVYHLGVHIPFSRLLATLITPERHNSSVMKDCMLIIGWEDNGSYLLGIHTIPMSPNEDEEAVLLNLGPIMATMDINTTIFCSHRCLISTGQRLFLYEIPELSPVREDVPLQAVVVTPLAVFGDIQADEQRKMPWNCLCSHHDGNRLPAVAELDIVVFPPAGQTAGTLVRHATWMCDFGPSRAIWYNTLPDESDEIELRSCTIFTHVDAHAGYMRLGRSKAPDPSRLFFHPNHWTDRSYPRFDMGRTIWSHMHFGV